MDFESPAPDEAETQDDDGQELVDAALRQVEDAATARMRSADPPLTQRHQVDPC